MSRAAGARVPERTAPQLVFVCPIAYTTERPVTDSAVTGAAFWTVRAGADAGAAATVPVPTSAAAIVEATRSRRTPIMRAVP
jgi:hypothetical protein